MSDLRLRDAPPQTPWPSIPPTNLVEPLQATDRYFYIFAALLGCRDRRTVCLGRAPANCNNTAGAAISK